jgi:putative transposase
MKERMQLVSLFGTGSYTVSELALRFDVSRKTAHKWLGRYAEHGVVGLDERSRAPKSHPNATLEPVVEAVLAAKKAHPTWGPAKLLPGSQHSAEIAEAWPTASTRGKILAVHGLVKQRRKRRHVVPWSEPFLEADSPNAVWCADFKGHFCTADGTRCDPLTITDAYSRMLLCCHIVPKADYAHVLPVFEKVFRTYGLPLAIRTDNGPPFASVGAGGLSRLSAWWVKLGILPERIEPGHPEQNGRHERMHRTLKQSTLNPPAATPEEQQRRFDDFCLTFNLVRPHEALGQVPPASLYTKSHRSYPKRVGGLVYPLSAELRRVRSNGEVKWHGGLVYVSEALVGEQVGITQCKGGWLASFGPIDLGLLRPGNFVLDHLPSHWELISIDKSVTYVLS